MNPRRRTLLLERYATAAEAVMVGLSHLDAEDLDARPSRNSWSPRETIHYLSDAELHEGINLRRMLSENTPVLLHWEDGHNAERLHYERPIEASHAAFQAVAASNIELLHALTEEQWHREANQQKPWPLTIDAWLEEHVVNLHNRLMHMLNSPMGGRVISDHEHESRSRAQ